MDDLKSRFAELKRKYYPSRQRFTLPAKDGQRTGVALESGKKLSDYGLVDGSVLTFKDLGPQASHQSCSGSLLLIAACLHGQVECEAERRGCLGIPALESLPWSPCLALHFQSLTLPRPCHGG